MRIVVDGRLRMPLTAQADRRGKPAPDLVPDPAVGSTRPGAAPLLDRGVELIDAAPDRSGVHRPRRRLATLGERGLTRLLVEGGAGLAAALLHAGLVDRLAWFHAPLVIGGDGIPAIAALASVALAGAPRFERVSTQTVGDDALTIFRAAR